MKVVGLRVEKYIDEAVDLEHDVFKYHDEEFTRHIICCVEGNDKYEIKLWCTEGICPSGYTTARWAHCLVEKVNAFNGFNYVPKDNLTIYNLSEGYHTNIDNKIFKISNDGGDEYYPSGYYWLDIKLFDKCSRIKENRPVWIFIGKSNMGKSFIAAHTDLSVYETDSKDELKDIITDDIVVLGNKYKYFINDIKERLFGNPEIHIVNFLSEEDYFQTNNYPQPPEFNLDDDIEIDEIFK